MSCYHYHQGTLFVEQCAVVSIAKKHGTPFFVYSKKYLVERWREYQQAVPQDVGLVCYAVKANSNLSILKLFSELGAGFDIVSQGELERVLIAGGDPKKIVFSGVGKSVDEIERALEVGILSFDVESIEELRRIDAVARRLGKVAPVALRVNPDVDAGEHPYISTGMKENKFGIDFSQALDAFQLARDLANVAIKGVACHIGSQILTIEPFVAAVKRLASLLEELKVQGIEVSHVDVGGGLGVCYEQENPPKVAEYVAALRKELAGWPVKMIFEPGRSLVAGAGLLVTKIEYVKQTPEKHFAIVDAGMTELMRPALYQAWQRILPVEEYAAGAMELEVDVVGPVCESADFFGKGRQLSVVEGGLLAVCDVGAYGASMASNYNSRRRPVEVLVDGENVHVIRERERYEALYADERMVAL